MAAHPHKAKRQIVLCNLFQHVALGTLLSQSLRFQGMPKKAPPSPALAKQGHRHPKLTTRADNDYDACRVE